MLFLDITARFIREIFRNRISLVVLIILPSFMAGMFWFAFNSSSISEAQTYRLGVINEDDGIANGLVTNLKYIRDVIGINIGLNDSTLNMGFAADFITILNTSTYPSDETSQRIFDVIEFTDETNASNAVQNRQISALVIFPTDYSNTTLAATNSAYFIQTGTYISDQPFMDEYPKFGNSTIIIKGDEGYIDYTISKMILEGFFEGVNEAIRGWEYAGGHTQLEIVSVALHQLSVFDTIMPGIYVFAALSQASFIAAFLVTELSENKTIIRIRLSLIKPMEYIGGVGVFALIMSFAQISLLMLISVFLLGFNPPGSFLGAMIVLLITTIFTTALGFIIASFFSSPDTAGQSTGFLMTPLAFMSGAFMDTPAITLMANFFPTASGLRRDFILWDLLPTTHSVNALRSILLYNFSLTDVLADVLFIAVPGLVLLALSMVLYNKRRFSGDIQ